MSFIAEIGDAVPAEVRIEWNVGDFFSLSDEVEHYYKSPDISFAGTKWCIIMYPNGTTRSLPGSVSLFLGRRDSGSAKIVFFTFGIKGSNGIEKMRPGEIEWEFPKDAESSYGLLNACTRSYLKNRKNILLPNNVLTVMCDLRSYSLNSFKGVIKLHKSLLDVLKSGDDSDVVMKVQGKEFPAHRVILRARSPVFRSMFQHDMVEKQSNVVTIEDCDPDTFHDFLVHVYTGRCGQISAKNVFSLFATADKYDIAELKEACTNFMRRNISVDCFCSIFTLAVKHNEEKLIESATTFFCSNSLDIIKTAAWQTFLKENPTVGNELFIKMLSK